MKYRALLFDPGNTQTERPIEVLGNHRAEMERWADAALAQAVSEDAAVKLYITEERELAIITRKGKP